MVRLLQAWRPGDFVSWLPKRQNWEGYEEKGNLIHSRDVIRIVIRGCNIAALLKPETDRPQWSSNPSVGVLPEEVKSAYLTCLKSPAALCIPAAVVWKRKVSHRFMCLNSWSPVGGSVWESHGNFRRRSLAEGGFWGSISLLHFLFPLSASCARMKMWPVSFLFLPPCFPCLLPGLPSHECLSLSGDMSQNKPPSFLN